MQGFRARDPLRCWTCNAEGSDLEELAAKMLASLSKYPNLVYMREVKVSHRLDLSRWRTGP